MYENFHILCTKDTYLVLNSFVAIVEAFSI